MADLTFVGRLTVIKCWCGISHAVPEELRNFQERQHRDGRDVISIWCPLGHQHAPAGKGAAEKLRERLEQEQQRSARVLAEKDQVEASLRSTRGALTKAKRRAANGVCPCCKRTFANVARHVKGQHPGFMQETSL